VAPFGTAPGTPISAWDIDGARSEGKGVWSICKDIETDKAIATEHSGGKDRKLTEDTPAAALRSRRFTLEVDAQARQPQTIAL